ncbi:MAG: 16S rRNA (cytosine(1402)-N(4))-methyltransferase RsmH [Candidatus Omnitrophica bacterium]|nr:16S rRNA (cytosine(1402)-N(4))-methyltransferase RsmH [Candidatus Omnitrophota bacterium]
MIRDAENRHMPVMLKAAVELLNPQPGAVIVDGTVGLAGHSLAIVERLGNTGRLIAIDQDAAALKIAAERLTAFAERCLFAQGNFSRLKELLAGLCIASVDGILLDIGVSSLQLDDYARGFNVRQEGPLEMRMDPSQGQTASDLVNRLSEREIEQIIREYGEERHSRRIARAIVQQRERQPIITTRELSLLILRCVGPRGRQDRIHPATRTFQALRIAVNRELEVLTEGLAQGYAVLRPQGRFVVIGFHSLEDRIVKNTFRAWGDNGMARALTKKPLRPSPEEIENNHRSRSARLRAVERI